MSERHRKYTPEFKDEAARMVAETSRGIAEVAREIHANEGTLDATETTDFYELVVERHRKAATVITSNREPSEWLAMMADPLLVLAQSAIDRLASTAHELIIEGDSYRRRQKPSTRTKTNTGVSVDQQTGDHHAH